MKKWIRNIVIGIAINYIKDLPIIRKVISRLKDKKAWVARIGVAIFTLLAAAKYYYPDLPVDDGIEVFGMLFSWLALEIGLDKSEVEKIEEDAKKEFDPTKPIEVVGILLPSPESVGIIKDASKKVSSDEN